MTRFLLAAWQLANSAEVALDQGSGGILRKSDERGELNDEIPPF